MSTWEELYRLRVFVDEDVRHHGRPVFELILEMAISHNLCGATVFRGIAGFGIHHHLHTARILRSSEQLPLVVEITDKEEAIEAFITAIEPIMSHGALSMEPIRFRRLSAKS